MSVNDKISIIMEGTTCRYSYHSKDAVIGNENIEIECAGLENDIATTIPDSLEGGNGLTYISASGKVTVIINKSNCRFSSNINM